MNIICLILFIHSVLFIYYLVANVRVIKKFLENVFFINILKGTSLSFKHKLIFQNKKLRLIGNFYENKRYYLF